MKKDLHDKNYRPVVFKDLSNGVSFLTKSTIHTQETIKWEDGSTYPLATVHITSTSHPFFTGEEKILDVEGRVDKFKARAEAAAKAKEAKVAKAEKAAKKPAKKAADTNKAEDAEADNATKEATEPKKSDKK